MSNQFPQSHDAFAKAFPLFTRRLISARDYTKCATLNARLPADEGSIILQVGNIQIGKIYLNAPLAFEDVSVGPECAEAQRIKNQLLSSTPTRRSTLSNLQDGLRKDLNLPSPDDSAMADADTKKQTKPQIENSDKSAEILLNSPDWQHAMRMVKESKKKLQALKKAFAPLIAEAKAEAGKKRGDIESHANQYPIIVLRKRRKK